MIKKLILPIIIVAALIGYVLYSRSGTSSMNTNSTYVSTVTSTPSSTTVAAFSTTTSTQKRYKDGTYTGTVADAFYGNVQVEAVIKGGLITDIQFLQYPSESGNTRAITQRVLPILKSEVIASQSSNVNGISGATQTTQAFQESLSAALSQAS